MGDRCGSREPKGASLKKSKSNPGCTAAKKKKAPKLIPTSLQSAMPPVPKQGLYFDCGSAMLSRQFDRDRDRVLARAESDAVSAIVTWFSDIEKQNHLYDLCKSNQGLCYFACGVHPDNIDRTNKKSHEGWLEKVEELARKPECIALLGGLNLSREIGTHFPQESMLRSVCAVADKVMLPLAIHCTDGASLARAIEVLREEEWLAAADEECTADFAMGHRKVIIHDCITSCSGNSVVLQTAIEAGCHFIVSAVGLTEGDANAIAKAEQCVASIPTDKLLSCTDSPWRTPQNIPDAYLRTLRNEPCNIVFVNSAIAAAVKMEVSELNARLHANALRVFGLEFASNQVADGLQGLTLESVSTSGAVEDASSASASGTPVLAADSSSTATVTAVTADIEPPTTVKRDSCYFCCQKCRTKLFDNSLVSQHAAFESRTVFRAGQEQGICTEVVFVPSTEEQLTSTVGMCMGRGKSMTVECATCGVKLGKFCASEALCACGATVSGPVVRLLAAKVDFVDTTLAQEELLARAKLEAESLGQQAARDEEAEEERRRIESKKTIKKGKKVASQNKGNFSSFRNKTFVPNASRSSKGKEGDGDQSDNDSQQSREEREEEVVTSKKSKKGKDKQQQQQQRFAFASAESEEENELSS